MVTLVSTLEKPAVLVVEWDASVQRLIREALAGVCDPSFAVLASMVIALLLEHSYDLVITATTLPGNVQGLPLIRTLPGYQDVPVIGIASDRQGAADGALPGADPVQGFATYYSQPPTPLALRQTILRLLTPLIRPVPIPYGDPG